MALLKFKKLLEDISTGSVQVIDMTTVTIPKATSAGESGSAYKATSAGFAGTARIAQFGSSGTGKLAGTHAAYGSGAEGF